MKWGIIGALDAEVANLVSHMQVERQTEVYGSTVYEGVLQGQAVAVVCCSVGKVNAAVCASTLIREFDAQALVNVGIAGAMGEGLQVMDIVLSSEAAFHDTDPVMEKYYPAKRFFPADPALLALCQEACRKIQVQGQVRVGRIATGDLFVSSKADKTRIAQALQPECVEMEGAAIAQVAFMNGVPFLIVRTMSDNADDAADSTYDNFFAKAADRSAALVEAMLALYQG